MPTVVKRSVCEVGQPLPVHPDKSTPMSRPFRKLPALRIRARSGRRQLLITRNKKFRSNRMMRIVCQAFATDSLRTASDTRPQIYPGG